MDGEGDGARIVNLDKATAGFPDDADRRRVARARPCSIPPARPAGPRASSGRCRISRRPSELPIFDFLEKLWRYRDGMIYLSPAPLYHSAPQAAVNLTIRQGGTAIIMERFDAEHYLRLVETYRVTHSQLVPTMFSRLLKLPDEVRRALRPRRRSRSRSMPRRPARSR